MEFIWFKLIPELKALLKKFDGLSSLSSFCILVVSQVVFPSIILISKTGVIDIGFWFTGVNGSEVPKNS